jgi:hypothetical protein
MYGRYWVDKIGNAPLHALATLLLYAVPLAGGVVLLALAGKDWSGTTRIEGDAALSPAQPGPAG